MADPFLGEIRLFAGNFAPAGWAFCEGQLLPISQSTALFALLGVSYGGNGRTTFALPDLRGRAPVHQGQGPGLTYRDVGEAGGSATVTLLGSQIPVHAHPASSSPAGTIRALNAVPATGGRYTGGPVPVGGAQPHNNRQPYLALSFIIALQGIFPARS